MTELIQITIILLASFLATTFSKRFGIPAVVGQLLVGIIVSPAILGLVKQTEILHFLSEIGVILLMFLAGLEADLGLLKKYLKPSLLVAISGVMIPLLFFTLYTKTLGYDSNTALFYGIVFAATSVSITVEVLQEYGEVKSKAGAVILGAAVADDILAVLILSFFISSRGNSSNFSLQILGQVIFLVFLFFVIKYLVPIIFKYTRRIQIFSKNTSIALIICFTLAILADLVGMSSVIGAFFAGLAIGQTSNTKDIEHSISTIAYTFFIPVFFVSIALPISFNGMVSKIGIIAIFTILAVLTKIAPAYISGRAFKFSKKDSLVIGSGMVSRGEMALIVVQIGLDEKIISTQIYSELVIVIILTTIIAPFILNYLFTSSNTSGTTIR